MKKKKNQFKLRERRSRRKMKIKSLSTITLVVLLAHCTIGIKFNSHKFTVSEVSSFSEDTWKEKFEAFITKYGKKYDTEEEYNKRFNAYKVKLPFSQLIRITIYLFDYR